MKNTVEKVIKRSIKICKNWKILTRNENFTAGQKMGANALLFFVLNYKTKCNLFNYFKDIIPRRQNQNFKYRVAARIL